MYSLEVNTRQPKLTARLTPLLLVHGAWHGAWCWEEHFAPYFANRGYGVTTLSYRGHGKSDGRQHMRRHSVMDYVADVAYVAQQIERERGVRPLVIGHSLGGFVTQKYLETYEAPAAILVAPVPVTGFFWGSLRLGRRHPGAFLKTMALFDPTYLLNTPDLLHDLCFSDDMPRDQVDKYSLLIGPEAFRAAIDAILWVRPNIDAIKGKQPLLVIAAENDRIFTVDEERRTAESYGAQFEIMPKMAHDLMLDRGWERVADTIFTWLTVQGI
ncbi:MAG: lysophospholipase [Anaerolineae bacterium]|jgi:pimeloyl-ACP methyl ester carboxylesterase|nr:lysophospholipase [Anaerolineae bacterium]